MKFWLAVGGLVLALSGPTSAAVPTPEDPAWPFFADDATALTARKAPQVWKVPTTASEVAYVFDVQGARFLDGGSRAGHPGISYGQRRGVHVASYGWPLRIRYRASEGATQLVVYWGVLP